MSKFGGVFSSVKSFLTRDVSSFLPRKQEAAKRNIVEVRDTPTPDYRPGGHRRRKHAGPASKSGRHHRRAYFRAENAYRTIAKGGLSAWRKDESRRAKKRQTIHLRGQRAQLPIDWLHWGGVPSATGYYSPLLALEQSH